MLLRGSNEGIHTKYSLCAGHIFKACISKKKTEARGFCVTFLVAQVELHRVSRTLPVPLETCSFKVSVSEGNGAHTCGTLDFLGVDQVLHCLSSVVLSVIFSCVCLSLWAMFHKQRCQSYWKLCWSPYRENSCT